MASQPDQVSALPLPPMQYVTLYSDENIRRGRAPKPPPPIQDMYTMFGRAFNADESIIRPLESQGIKRLYPQHFDRRKELKKLNQSLLVNFLDLLDILILCPESPKRTEKIDDISILFIHMHHLINEYRPHQARETLRVTLEVQKRQRLETNFRFRKHIQKVCSSVQHALENLPEIKLDAELLTDIEKLLKDESKSEKSNKFDQVTPQDRIMCKIVDDLVASHRSSKQKKN